jgi:uncharacterized membrane protein YfcA
MNFGYTLSGLLVGLLVGVTGVGGGSLMTPLLVFLFGFNPAVAVGTDLLFAAITKTSGVWVHHTKHGSVNWKVVTWLACGSLPCSVITLMILKHFLDIGKEVTGAITFTLGVALLLTAVSLIVRSIFVKQTNSIDESDDDEQAIQLGAIQISATIFVGAILGVLVTLSSVGAGALGTVALLFLYPKMKSVKIVGTDLAHAIPLTAVAGLGHLSLGNVDFVLLGSLLVGSLPGIWVGSHLSAKIPEKLLRIILAIILLLIGTKFVLL